MEGIWLIACWGWHVGASIVQGFLQQQGGLVQGVLKGPGVAAGPGVAEGTIPLNKQAASIGSSQRV